MVPFIDVMLVLLIIFMVTAPLITPSLIELPSVGKANRPPDVKVEVVILKDGSLELRAGSPKTGTPSTVSTASTQRLALADLSTRVLQAQSGQAAGSVAVVISADRSVKYESVVKVMDTLQRAGVQRVGLSVQLAP